MQPPFAKAWAARWQTAGIALAEVKRQALATMSDDEGLAASDALLSLAAPDQIEASRLRTSGLVIQQRLLRGLQPER